MSKQLLYVLVLGVSMSLSSTSYSQTNITQPTYASKEATQADRALGRAVRRALDNAQGFDVSGVFVRARGGTVTLSGTVTSGNQIQRAEYIAKSVQGVTAVNNKLALFHGGNG
jgi:osmotically-inducible protein OsmY